MPSITVSHYKGILVLPFRVEKVISIQGNNKEIISKWSHKQNSECIPINEGRDLGPFTVLYSRKSVKHMQKGGIVDRYNQYLEGKIPFDEVKNGKK